jgi:hypothetical protein
MVNRSGQGRYIPVMKSSQLWAHEARRLGPATLALPVLGAAGIAALAVFERHTWTAANPPDATTARFVAYVMPVAVGLAGAAVIPRERMLELHLSLPTSFPLTVYRRYAVLGTLSLVATAAVLAQLVLTGAWDNPARGVAALLIAGGPAALLLGVGAWAGARWQASAAASSLVLAAWLAQVMVWDRFVGDWRLNKILLLCAAAALAVAASRRLADSERLLTGVRDDQ